MISNTNEAQAAIAKLKKLNPVLGNKVQKQLSDILPGYTPSKPGLWNQIDSKYVFPFESLKIKLAEIEQTSKPMPKIETIKVQLINVPKI